MRRRHQDSDFDASVERMWQSYADELGIPGASTPATEALPREGGGPMRSRPRRVTAQRMGRGVIAVGVAIIGMVAGVALWREVLSSAGRAQRRSASVTSVPTGAAPQATLRSATAGTHLIDKNRRSTDLPARIMFDIGSDRLDEASQAKLNEILIAMTAYPDWHFAVEGHTDAYGAPEYNRSLSERRAQAVKSYLEAAGIASERISVAAFGASRPVAPNNAQGRALNRRVEIRRQ